MPGRAAGSLTAMFDGTFRTAVDKAVKPVGDSLRRTGLSPDHLTVLGLVVAVFAAVAIGAGYLQLGLLLVILAALPDLFDGALAKASNTSSQRGAFFDSVIDRVTDALLFAGLAWHFAVGDTPLLAMLPFGVLAVSSVISYERAKAESLGLDAKGGLMERAERIILLCLGLLFEPLLVWILGVMLMLTAITPCSGSSRSGARRVSPRSRLPRSNCGEAADSTAVWCGPSGCALRSHGSSVAHATTERWATYPTSAAAWPTPSPWAASASVRSQPGSPLAPSQARPRRWWVSG